MNIYRSYKWRVSAWIMIFSIILSVGLSPVVRVNAATSTPTKTAVVLRADITETTEEVENNVCGTEFEVPGDYNTSSKLAAAELAGLQVRYIVTECTPVADAIPEVRLYTMYGDDGTYREETSDLVVGEEAIMTVELPVSAAADFNIYGFGMDFSNVTGSFTYKIISAKLISEGYEEEPEIIVPKLFLDKESINLSVGENGGEKDVITAEVTPKNSDYREINWSIPANTVIEYAVDSSDRSKLNITAVGDGTVIVTATVVGTDISKECVVTVEKEKEPEPEIEITRPCVIDISKLPGGAEYTDDSYLENLYIKYMADVSAQTALYDENTLTLLIGTEFRLTGKNDKLTVIFKQSQEYEEECEEEGIVLSDVTIKAVDCEVPVRITGNTVVKGDVKAKNIEIASGIVSVTGNIDAENGVVISDGKVSVGNGISSEGTVVIGSKAMLSVNVDNNSDKPGKSAISGAEITIENGADIVAGEEAKTGLFSVTPKNEKGETIDVSRYTANNGNSSSGDSETKTDQTGKTGNETGNTTTAQSTDDGKKNEDKTADTPVTSANANNESSKQIKATDMSLTADVKAVKGVALSDTYWLAAGKSMTVTAAFSPEGAENESVTLTSSDSKVVSVNGTKLTAKKAGTAKVTVVSQNGLTRTFSIKVTKKAISKVKIKTLSKVVKKGKKINLKTVTTPKKNTSNKFYWKSANESVATVTQKGVVRGIKKGKVKITAVALDGSGKKATVTIRVK